MIAGSGRIKLDGDIQNLRPLDAVRIAPGVAHALEGGKDGIEFLAFGPRHEGDGEMVDDFWAD